MNKIMRNEKSNNVYIVKGRKETFAMKKMVSREMEMEILRAKMEMDFQELLGKKVCPIERERLNVDYKICPTVRNRVSNNHDSLFAHLEMPTFNKQLENLLLTIIGLSVFIGIVIAMLLYI